MSFCSGRRGHCLSVIFAASLLAILVAPQCASAQEAQTEPTPAAPIPLREQTPVQDENFRYNNLYEISGSLMYGGLPSGPNIPMRAQLPGAGVSATQWIYPRLGATADLRLYAGLGNTNANPYNVNSPLFVESFLSVGPEYRVVRTPSIGISLHGLAGGGYGEFNFHVPSGVSYQQLGNYPNGGTWDIIGGANIDFNRPSGFAVRVSPNVITTDFNGDLRTSFTISAGLVFRFGKF